MDEALPNMQLLKTSLAAAIIDISLSLYAGSNADVLEVLSSVFLIKQAVEAMEGTKEIGEENEEEQKKALILTIVTAVLAIVPVIGEVSAAAMGLVAVAASAGMAIVDIIENPKPHPWLSLACCWAARSRIPRPLLRRRRPSAA